MSSEILVWNKQKYFRSCFYHSVFEKKWIPSGYFYFLKILTALIRSFEDFFGRFFRRLTKILPFYMWLKLLKE